MLAKLSRFTLPAAILLAALASYRYLIVEAEGPPIELPKNAPLVIVPRHNEPRAVTDEQLAAVLARVKPPTEVSTNNYVHALRLWGADADFGDDRVPTGNDLRRYFLDDAVFRHFAGDSAPPLFYVNRGSIDVRGYDDQTTNRETSSFHTDDLLATLAETGTSLDTPLIMRDRPATVADLLKSSLGRFHLEQLEYEWTAIAYARYVFPATEWRNQYGEKITVDALVTELTSHPPHVGPCNGLHRLEALAVLNCADEQHHALSRATRRKMLTYMKQASLALTAAQAPEGFWTRDWPRGAAALATSTSTSPSLHDKLLVTGHHLEWLALAPDEVQPPREHIIRAAQWLARTLVEMDDKDLAAAYGPYTHAARALSLWRGQEPNNFYKSHTTDKTIHLTTF
jgi:hypothetical protein